MAKITIDTDKAKLVAENLLVTEVEGKLILLIVDPTKSIGPSKSGKMIGICSTGGFTGLLNDIRGNIWIGRSSV